MKRLLLPLAILLPLTLTATAQEHHHGQEQAPLTREQLLERFQAWTGHPMKSPVIVDASTVINGSPKAFSITAKSFDFVISPSPLVVNEGDVVTLTINVPSNDQSSIGHGMLMEQYIDPGVNVGRGQTKTVTFTASVAGTFQFICTQSSCGTGHSNMSGTLVVNAGAPAPTITSVTPATLPAAGGVTVHVKGNNFDSKATANLDGSLLTLSSLSTTQAVFTAPAHGGGQATFTIVNSDGQSASAFLTYTAPPPSISSLTPTQVSTLGGSVTINGSNFVSGASVSFGSTKATVSSVTATQIVLIAPALPAGSVTVTLTNPDGQTATSSVTYIDVPLSMSTVSPSSGPNSGTPITITGTGFVPGATVTIGSGTAVDVRVLSSTSISAAVHFAPADQALGVAQDVVVKNPDGKSASKSGAFTFALAPLSIGSVGPNRGLQGTMVIISGTGFSASNPVTITFGGVPATSTKVIDSVTVVATAPAHGNGAVDLAVTTNGTSITAANAFLYAPTPVHRRSAGH